MPLSLAHIDTLLIFTSEDRGVPRMPGVPPSPAMSRLGPAERDRAGRAWDEGGMCGKAGTFFPEAWRIEARREISPMIKIAAMAPLIACALERLAERYIVKGWKTFIRNVSQPCRISTLFSSPPFHINPRPSTVPGPPAGLL